MNSSTKLFLVTVVAVAALTACGGGGSGGDAPQTPTPAASDYLPLVTAVPVPTYAAASRELAEFNNLNAQRAKCGFGLLTQDKALDLAAHDHQAYISTPIVAGRQDTYADGIFAAGLSLHEQQPALFPNGFTGVTGQDRAKFRGYTGVSAGETITAGLRLVSHLLAAPYHASTMLTGFTDVGVSVADGDGWAVFDFGVKSTPQMFAAAVLTYPCEGVTGTDIGLPNEIPSPYAPRDLAKNPIGQSVYFVGRGDGLIEVAGVSMTEVVSGASVVMLPVQSHLNDSKLSRQFAFASPDAPLQYSTAYRVKATVKSNGKTVPIDYTFTTVEVPPGFAYRP